MALMATFRSVPFRSMPSRISSASRLAARASSTFSLLFTDSTTLGLTSRETTEATAFIC